MCEGRRRIAFLDWLDAPGAVRDSLIRQSLLDIGLDIALGGEPHLGGNDGSLAIDKEGGGHGVETTVLLAKRVAVDEDGVVDLFLIDELGDGRLVFGPAGLVVLFQVVSLGVDAEDFKSLGCVPFAELDDPRRLNFAGAAPGGPEIDEDGFAFVVGEGDFFAAEIFKREGGRRLAGEGGLILGRAVGVWDEFALGGRSEEAGGGLLAILPVGPSGPGEDGENAQDCGNDDGVALQGNRPLPVLLYEKERGFGWVRVMAPAEATAIN